MPGIEVVPLGAGQDVGRSCILVTIGGKNVMFDCGMHMGYHDERRFPDFSYISRTGDFTNLLDCIIISHFHLDHCGALVHFTEMCGYDGPIYMTHPTKAICPILLEDYRKISTERHGARGFFTSSMIKECMKKVIAVNVHESIAVDEELTIKPYYAGHVLGAAMFHVRVGNESMVYTGDYNMTPDRHLGAAWIDKCRPDLLITESTYATTIRDSKRARERDFLKKVHACVEKGGKVLIPVFALGRAQELCILIDTYWERMNLQHVPIYFSAGLTAKANDFYKLFINWTNQKIKRTFVERNMFDFANIQEFERHYADAPGPMVLFATPGMLHAGTSLHVFKKWAGHAKNMVILPGYCVQGTVGHKLLAGQRKAVEVDRGTMMDVKMDVCNLSFSAHADAKGIMQLIRQSAPKNVLLVHGEAKKMEFLKEKIETEYAIPCYCPPNGTMVTVPTSPPVVVHVSRRAFKRAIDDADANEERASKRARRERAVVRPEMPVQGVILYTQESGDALRLLEKEEAIEELGVTRHRLVFRCTLVLLPAALKMPAGAALPVITRALYKELARLVSPLSIVVAGCSLTVGAVALEVKDVGEVVSVHLEWPYEAEAVGARVCSLLRTRHLVATRGEEDGGPQPMS